jgi:mannose-6-phosphate isomerase
VNHPSLYPLRFEPICQYRLWGGRRLADLLRTPLPGDGPIGEAWILSDRDDFPSRVADGPLKGQTIKQLLETAPEQMLGELASRYHRFPLLLKFLDAHAVLSVQVHPSDSQKEYIPPGEHGKTEAWVVLQATPNSKIYAGLKAGTNLVDLQNAVANHTVPDNLASIIPNVGDCVFVHSGTVHTISDVVVFEVQENSDVTLRLYDWDRVDPKTGKARNLTVPQALACIDFARGPVELITPITDAPGRERIFDCEHFVLWRLCTESPFTVGAPGSPRVLVCVEGDGELEHKGVKYDIGKGDVMLLPAVVGTCCFSPHGQATVLEVSLPEDK